MYQIKIKKSAFKELQALVQTAIVQIETAIEELATNPLPHGCKKLKGGEAL